MSMAPRPTMLQISVAPPGEEPSDHVAVEHRRPGWHGPRNAGGELAALSLAEKTDQESRERIYAKLGVGSRDAAITQWRGNGKTPATA